MKETPLLQTILLAIGALPNCRFWRANAGQAWAGQPVRLNPGQVIKAEAGDVLLKRGFPVRLGPDGLPDINGIVEVEITPDMIGQKLGVFIGLEVKTATGRLRDSQKGFGTMLRRFGGIAEVVRSKDQALSIVKDPLQYINKPLE